MGTNERIDAMLRPRPVEGGNVPVGARMHDRVVFHSRRGLASRHDGLTKARLAERLAELLGLDYAGVHSTARAPDGGRTYYVPDDSVHAQDAMELGIHGPADLFGGVVPENFVATKVITHALARADSAAPQGWSTAFADRVREVVLPGHSAFSADDARRAGSRLLEDGAVRLKAAAGVGGNGQHVIERMADLEAHLRSFDPAELRRHGVVLERNLNAVQTCSVGQVQVGAWRLSYHGRQRLTRDHAGRSVYGGSTLRLVRGGYAELLATPLQDEVRTAVEQAVVYHEAAMQEFPGLFASRCNYDVAQGIDDAGQWRSGVLEQSWRIGGASGAEIAALQAWMEQPGLAWVDASTCELYEPDPALPAGAQVLYDGTDPQVGRLVKYAIVDGHGHTH